MTARREPEIAETEESIDPLGVTEISYPAILSLND
jgi:hypothetical protein